MPSGNDLMYVQDSGRKAKGAFFLRPGFLHRFIFIPVLPVALCGVYGEESNMVALHFTAGAGKCAALELILPPVKRTKAEHLHTA